MSVYKPGKSPFYHYDFQYRGQRFSGSTGCRRKSEAAEVERQEKDRVKAAFRAQSGHRAPAMTIDFAADRFWIERGQYYRGNAQATFKASLAWLVRQVGPNRLISDISNGLVAELAARRRGEGVSNATVNRTVTEPLRRVLRRAASAWEQTVPTIRWGEHVLDEPKERVRELKAGEEARLRAALPADYGVVFSFALLSGCRLGECVGLKWEDIDWGNREIVIRGKGETVASIPLTAAMRALLWPLQAHHRERVFTYQAGTDEAGDKPPPRQPITYEGMKTAWRRARARAGVKDFRFHDNRHTAATRLLRSGANIKAVQKLLRHTDIATTSKYAHVTMDDLRHAMERAAETRISENDEASPGKLPEVGR